MRQGNDNNNKNADVTVRMCVY